MAALDGSDDLAAVGPAPTAVEFATVVISLALLNGAPSALYPLILLFEVQAG
ncbi:MAG: hypothetical protein WKF75_08880 [Singulisphaera sp.]